MIEYTITTIVLLSAGLAVQALKAPVIHLHSSKEAALGTKVTIECLAEGDPRPTVEWYRNGVYIQGQEAATFPPMMPYSGGAKYKFTAVQGSGGPYECLARNGIADSNGNTNITKVMNVNITGESTTTRFTTSSTPQTTPLSTAQATYTPEPTPEKAGKSTTTRFTTSSTPQTTPLSTTQATYKPEPTPEKTDPTNPVSTKTSVKPVDNKTTANISGSDTSSALSLVAVFMAVVVTAFFF